MQLTVNGKPFEWSTDKGTLIETPKPTKTECGINFEWDFQRNLWKEAPKSTKQLIEIEVPFGKQLVETQTKSGVLFTFEDVIDWKLEKQKCLGDKTRIYMIEKYLAIYDPQSNTYKPFKLLDHQKGILESFVDYKNTTIKQYRQAGVSSLEAAYIATELILNPETNVVLFDARLECGINFIEKVKTFISQIPNEIKGEDFDFVINNSKRIDLLNGARLGYFNSKIDSTLSNYNLKNVTHLIIDNAAFVEISMVVKNILNEFLIPKCKIIISSIYQDGCNTFSTAWERQDAVSDIVIENKIELFWFEDERYNKDLEWFNSLTGEKAYCTKDLYQTALLKGYLPTNKWFKKMSKLYDYNKEKIETEIGVGYYEELEQNTSKTITINYNYTKK